MHSIIFSNNTKYKLSRHFLFWCAWILYYTLLGSLSSDEKASFMAKFFVFLTQIILSLPVHMIFCYGIIYLLIPRYLNTGRYATMVILWLAFSLVCIFMLRAFHGFMAPGVRKLFGFPPVILTQNVFSVVLDYFADFNMQGCLAASIKLGKMWYVKQQELSLLNNEKNKLQSRRSLDNDSQTSFFADFFYNIVPAFNGNDSLLRQVSGKIRNLLIYVSSASNQSKIKLRDELSNLSDYLEIERIFLQEQCVIEQKIEGDIDEQLIAPLIVLPLVDGSLTKLKELALTERKLHIETYVKKSNFRMKIIFSKPPDSSVLQNSDKDYLQNITERLELIYPQSYNFALTIAQDNFVIELSIDLSSAIS